MLNASIKSNKINLILDTIAAVVDECKIRVSEESISTSAADKAGICVVDVSIEDEAFNTFEASKRTIGVDISEMNDILSIAEDEIVSLKLKNHHLEGVFEEVDYHSALIDLDYIETEQDIPDLDLEAEFTIPSLKLDKAVNVTSRVGERVEIISDPDAGKVRFKASGDDNRVEVDFDRAEIPFMNDHGARAVYSLNYMKDISRVIPENRPVQIHFGVEFPMVISYEILDGHGEVSFMLAPRIEES